MKEARSMMGSTVGQIEKKTQQRVVRLFREQLGYDSLGDRIEREGNCNIEEDLLRAFLREKQGCDGTIITRALHLLGKEDHESGSQRCLSGNDEYPGQAGSLR